LRKRFLLPATTFMVGLVVVLAGWAVLARIRQVHREHELALSWIDVGRKLDQMAQRIGSDRTGFPDAWELTQAADDSLVRLRLDSAEARLWRLIMHSKPPLAAADSLRGVMIRARERQGLALAHCRSSREGWLGEWALTGFPRR
jgi:hypothetical protein